jgi:lipoprotein-releasing system permease protein
MILRLYIKRYLFAPSSHSVVKSLSRLSILGIALGVLAMIVVLSVMNGFHETILKRLLKSQPHLVVTGLSAHGEKQLRQDVPQAYLHYFSKQDIIVRTSEGLFSGAVAYGVLPGRLEKLGSVIGPKILKLAKDDIALGVDLARNLGVFEGDELTVISPESLLVAGETPTYQKVRVRALIRTDLNELDSKTLYYSDGVGLSRIGHTSSFESGYEILLPDPFLAKELKMRLLERGYRSVQTWEDLNSALFYSLKMEKSFMGLFLGITVLVSCFSVISVIFLLVTEKENDIRVLKFIGAKTRQVRDIFLVVGVVLGGIGISLGIIGGLFICWLIKTFPLIRLPDVFLDTQFPVKVEAPIVATVGLLGMAIVIGSSVWPANRAAKLKSLDTQIPGVK